MNKTDLLNAIFEIGQDIENFNLKNEQFPTEEEILQQHKIKLPYGEDVLKGWISAKKATKAEYVIMRFQVLQRFWVCDGGGVFSARQPSLHP